MIDKDKLADCANLFKQVKSCLILLPKNPSLDAVASALALYLSLKKTEKSVQIGCETPMSVAFNRLFGVDKVKTKVGSKNLMISFPYVESAVEKVSYHVEGQKFNLVITPRQGSSALDADKISYSHSGIDVALVVVVGAGRFEDIGELYEKERDVLINTPNINIDNKPNNTQFCVNNLADSESSSCAEIMTKLIRIAALPLNGDLATNLVAGIESATNNLQFKTNAETFEAIAWLMRQGGKRGHLAGQAAGQSANQPDFPPGQIGMPSGNFGNPMPFPAMGTPFAGPASPLGGMNPFGFPPVASVSNPPPPAGGPPPMPFVPKSAPPITQESEATDLPIENAAVEDGNSQSQPAPDWFKPKIFKGKNLL